jgi:hypothetical protein
MHATSRSCAASFVRSQREERDIGAAFLSESRTSLLGGMPSVAGDASWVGSLLLQKNANLQPGVPGTIEPMRVRSSLDAREYYDHKAYEPLRHEFHWAPGMFYNFGGKLALSRSTWDAHQFPSRVHDEDGRITCSFSGGDRRAPGPGRGDARSVFHASQSLHRRTHGVRLAAQTLGFACLHTASITQSAATNARVGTWPKAP